MNEWIIAHDDGKTPAIHTKRVTAATMSDALQRSGLDQRWIWACWLRSEGYAAAVLAYMELKRDSAPE